MILQEFSNYLQKHDKEIVENHSILKLLCAWVIAIQEKPAQNNVERIVQTEITYATNSKNEFLLIGKSKTGQKLVESLYNFALSYEQYVMQKWLEDKKASDFNKNL